MRAERPGAWQGDRGRKPAQAGQDCAGKRQRVYQYFARLRRGRAVQGAAAITNAQANPTARLRPSRLAV
ncbi:hypothetical protein BRPE64_BCDS00780 [Caballeronia insecticola]|uniref:Uncharacterized protein n=1 Tax=Caballeronia insecticola TaxID=758793 RepID=R4WK05_9BURK|nr:hypothetical protein BRPE64_BCDS00780 [Caballeronia insecticola]